MAVKKLTNDISLVKMSAELVPAVAGIENACFSHPWTAQGLEAELSKESAFFYVAVINNIAVGYMGFQIILDEAYVDNIAVLPEYRRLGAARALLDNAINICISKNVSFITLEVRPSNTAALSLYQSAGFVKAGQRRGFYSSPTEDALIMTRYFNNGESYNEN